MWKDLIRKKVCDFGTKSGAISFLFVKFIFEYFQAKEIKLNT